MKRIIAVGRLQSRRETPYVMQTPYRYPTPVPRWVPYALWYIGVAVVAGGFGFFFGRGL